MNNENIDPLVMQELQQLQQEEAEDQLLDNIGLTAEEQELYGAPEPEERHNQHTFIAKTVLESADTIRSTFLFPEELGRADFSVRFLENVSLVAKQVIDPLCKSLERDPNTDNLIKTYFKEKREIITSSGLSNRGFIQNINITRRMDATRTRKRDPIDNLEGGKK